MPSSPWNRAGAVVAGSIVTAAVFIGLGLAFANPPQCPPNVSEEELLETGCNIGANIGLGMIFMAAVAVLVVGGITAFALYSRDSHPTPPPPVPPPPP